METYSSEFPPENEIFKYFICRWKLTALSFRLKMKYLNIFLLKIAIKDERQHFLKSRMQDAELNLHFSIRYL